MLPLLTVLRLAPVPRMLRLDPVPRMLRVALDVVSAKHVPQSTKHVALTAKTQSCLLIIGLTVLLPIP